MSAGGRPQAQKARVPVPMHVRTRLLGLGGQKDTCKLLRISDVTYHDAVDPHGLLRPVTLQKIQSALNDLDAPPVQRESP
jgi:hypothetical protein